MDIFERVRQQKGNIGQYAKQAHGYFSFPKLEGEIGPRMKFRGKEVLNWSLNNYIGLANDPEVRKADAEAAAKYGMAYPMGARMMSGQTSRHEYLESQLAEFVGKPDAFLLNFGYQGMVSIIDVMIVSCTMLKTMLVSWTVFVCLPQKDMCTSTMTWKACVNNWKERPNGWKTPVVVF